MEITEKSKEENFSNTQLSRGRRKLRESVGSKEVLSSCHGYKQEEREWREQWDHERRRRPVGLRRRWELLWLSRDNLRWTIARRPWPRVPSTPHSPWACIFFSDGSCYRRERWKPGWWLELKDKNTLFKEILKSWNRLLSESLSVEMWFSRLNETEELTNDSEVIGFRHKHELRFWSYLPALPWLLY